MFKLITSPINVHTAESRLDPRPVNLAVFVLYIVATGQGFLRVHSFTPSQYRFIVSPEFHARGRMHAHTHTFHFSTTDAI